VPYVAHLLSVAAIALEHGADEDEAIAALLHDAIEDQGRKGQTREDIQQRFGERVREIVEGCTDTDQDPKPPWQNRKAAYLVHLPHASQSVHLVSAADKLHNARTILADLRRQGESLWDRFNGKKEGTLLYYRSLAAFFQHAPDPRLAPLAEELDRVVTDIERLAAAPPPR
jgi:(p)ppGpp synthase/HD superfamily hydrolase